MNLETKPLTEDEEALVEEKINEYGDSQVPQIPHTEEEQLVYKVQDEEGKVIGGCIVNIHLWGRAVLANLWVDEKYRRHGLGSMISHHPLKLMRPEWLILRISASSSVAIEPLFLPPLP